MYFREINFGDSRNTNSAILVFIDFCIFWNLKFTKLKQQISEAQKW